MALSKTSLWPAVRLGISRATGSVDCRGLTLGLGGDARGAQPGSKVSLTIMDLPLQGQVNDGIRG